MNQNNNVNEQYPGNGSDIDEVAQLCHEYSDERENFHKLGFQCLLKKLKEIEKIILAVGKMSGNDAFRIPKNSTATIQKDVIETANSPVHVHSPATEIPLPDELTFHSKQVLQKIFENFETSIFDMADKLKNKFYEILNDAYCDMDAALNALNLEQKAEAKNLIEALLSSDIECVDENTPKKERLVVSRRSRSSANFHKLLLPEDLNPFTRSVLNEIFENYEINVNDFATQLRTVIHELLKALYGRFEFNVNGMAEKQKSQLSAEMEAIFADQNEVQLSQSSAAVAKEKKMKSANAVCLPFDTQLAHHFQELSRLVKELLDRKDNTEVTIDENQMAVVPDDAGAVAPTDDDLDDTQFKEVEKFKSKGNRFLRLF